MPTPAQTPDGPAVRTSAEPGEHPAARAAEMLDEAWMLDASVALRPEPFGALAYHFGTRKLVFLKRPELVAVVTELGAQPSVRAALVAAGVPEASWSAYVGALAGLADSQMIRPRRPGREVAA